MGLKKLAKAIKDCKDGTLKPLFSVKTHKADNPFRVIVEDKGTWQRTLATILQAKLSLLPVNDPFLIMNFEEVVEFLKTCPPVTCVLIDIKDLYYNIPQNKAISAVVEAIDTYGAVKFQNLCGFCDKDFLRLLELYLKSLYTDFEGHLYVQDDGISIGSCLAPVLSDIFLAAGDQGIGAELGNTNVVACFRYVDDYLMCLDTRLEPADTPEQLITVFKDAFSMLEFTHEAPENSCIHFLDLHIKIGMTHTCSMYKTRSEKGLLRYDSAHSKIVRRGIAVSCLTQAIGKTCYHLTEESYALQTSRLRNQGYPDSLLALVSEKLLQSITGGTRNKEKDVTEKKTPVAMPYIHGISHSLQKRMMSEQFSLRLQS